MTKKIKYIRKILMILSVVTVFAACKSKTSLDPAKDQTLVDSGRYNNTIMSDTPRTSDALVVPPGNVQTSKHVTSTIPRGYRGRTRSDTTIRTTTTNGITHIDTTVTTNTGSATHTSTGNGVYSGGSGSSGSSGGGTTATTTRRRGWSKAAQGAAIGGVGGAVGGAIISRNKGKGAVIGGVLGAAGGYIIGRGKDKRDGRVRR